jgi:hypothetical protein
MKQKKQQTRALAGWTFIKATAGARAAEDAQAQEAAAAAIAAAAALMLQRRLNTQLQLLTRLHQQQQSVLHKHGSILGSQQGDPQKAHAVLQQQLLLLVPAVQLALQATACWVPAVMMSQAVALMCCLTGSVAAGAAQCLPPRCGSTSHSCCSLLLRKAAAATAA